MHEAMCLSGGGTKAITLLGMLYEWKKSGRLENIKTISACSAGAFIAVLYLCKINFLQMLKFIPKMENVTPSLDILQTLMTKAGIKRIQKYTKKVREIVFHFTGIEECTLKDFFDKTGVTLYIEAVDITNCEVVYFNHIDHPTCLLMDAVHASAAIPGVFIPIKIGKSSFIDGGFYSAMPIEPIMDLETVAFGFANNNSEMFLITMIKLHSSLVKKEAIKRHKKLTVVECISNFGLLDFNKTYEELFEEFVHGRKQCENWDVS